MGMEASASSSFMEKAMVTVVDPLGTPVPVYNRSGVAIVQVSGGTTMSPGIIPQVSGITVAIVTTSPGNDKVQLPSGAEIGDVVELVLSGGSGSDTLAPAGEDFFPAGSNSIATNAATIMRKVTSTSWSAVRSA